MRAMCFVSFAAWMMVAVSAYAGEIHDAAKAGNTNAVLAQLGSGVEADEPDGDKKTALYYAVKGGHLQAARILLDSGAKPDFHTSPHGTLLEYASIQNDKAMVELLLEFNANPSLLVYHVIDDMHFDTTAIHTVNDIEIARLLLSNGGNPNIQDGFGGSPLSRAAERSNRAMIELLLDHGADPDHGKDYLLREYNIQPISYVTQAWSNPLVVASAKGDLDIVRLLLERGATLIRERGYKETKVCPALNSAIEHGQMEVFNYLLERGAPVTDDTNWPPLHIAIFHGQEAIARELIQRGAPLNAPEDGYSPLQWAILSGNKEMIALLLNAGADWSSAKYFENNTAISLILYAMTTEERPSFSTQSEELYILGASQAHKLTPASAIELIQSIVDLGLPRELYFPKASSLLGNAVHIEYAAEFFQKAPGKQYLEFVGNPNPSWPLTRYLLELGAPTGLNWIAGLPD